MKPMKCSVIRRKEKNTISTGKTGRMQNNLKKPDNPEPVRAGVSAGRPEDTFSDFGGDDFGAQYSDFFEQMFGSGVRRNTKFRGQDYQAELHLSLRDAAKTHSQTLTINEKNIRITIPAGVEDGQVIRLKNHGAPGANGGPSGDLYITFRISRILFLNGLGMICILPLTWIYIRRYWAGK